MTKYRPGDVLLREEIDGDCLVVLLSYDYEDRLSEYAWTTAQYPIFKSGRLAGARVKLSREYEVDRYQVVFKLCSVKKTLRQRIIFNVRHVMDWIDDRFAGVIRKINRIKKTEPKGDHAGYCPICDMDKIRYGERCYVCGFRKKTKHAKP